MHVRIGVTHNPREIEIELADGTDPEAVKGAVEQAVASGRNALAHRQEGPPSRHPGREAVLGRDGHRPPTRTHRLRRHRRNRHRRDICERRPPRSAAALRHGQGRRRQDVHRGGARAARVTARQAHARRARSTRRATLPTSSRPAATASSRARSQPGLFAMAMDTEQSLKEYLRLQLQLPLVARIGPLARSLDFVAQRRAGREGDPHRRQAPVEVARAPLRPRRRRRRGHRTRRGAARPRRDHPRARAGRHGARPDAMDARHPERPGADGRRHRRAPRGDAGQRDHRARRSHQSDDERRSRRRRREPGAARAVRARRGGSCSSASASRPGAARRQLSPARASQPRARRRRARRATAPHAARRTSATLREELAGGALPLRARAVRPQHGLRATKQSPRRSARSSGSDGATAARTTAASRSMRCSRRRRSSSPAARAASARRRPRRPRRRWRPPTSAGRCSCSPSTPPAGWRTRSGSRRSATSSGASPTEAFAAAGVDPRGELWVAMLDTKQSWDDLVRRHAPDAADPRRDPRQPALREHHGSLRAEPRLHRDGAAVRHPRVGRLRPPRRRHAADPQRARLPRRTGPHGRVLQQPPPALADRALSVSGDELGLEALLPARRPHPRLAVPPRHRRVLHPLPDDVRRVRRAGQRRAHACSATAARRSWS